MVPQSYSRMSTPTPVQPFTPPSLTPSHNPATPGSGHRLRGGYSASAGFGPSPMTPSQLGTYGSNRGGGGSGTAASLLNNSSTSSALAAGATGGSTRSGKSNTYKKLTIAQTLDRFENVLANLVESVSKFRPSVDDAKTLIAVDEELTQSIAELVAHQRAAKKLLRLRRESASLDEQLNMLLVTLADCRRTLRGLPRPHEKYLKAFELKEQQQRQQQESTQLQPTQLQSIELQSDLNFIEPLTPRVSAKELLQYATKVTKFTSAPPGYNQAAPEHANFPWPTEDEMRRGVLALSAIAGTLNPKDESEVEPLVDSSTVSASTSATATTGKSAGTISATGLEENSSKQQTGGSNGISMAPVHRRDSRDYGEQRPDLSRQAVPQTTSQLDLDLFDPDDDEDEEMEDI